MFAIQDLVIARRNCKALAGTEYPTRRKIASTVIHQIPYINKQKTLIHTTNIHKNLNLKTNHINNINILKKLQFFLSLSRST